MSLKVPQKSITYIIICLSIIVVLLVIGVYPLYRALATRDDQIAEKNLKLEEQKLLLPVYEMLKQKIGKKNARTLPLPANAQLPSDQIDKLERELKEISGKAKVELVSFLPGVAPADGKSKSMSVDVMARGEFFSMRKFLIGLGSIPYVEHIEEVQLSRTADALEIKVKFRVAKG